MTFKCPHFGIFQLFIQHTLMLVLNCIKYILWLVCYYRQGRKEEKSSKLQNGRRKDKKNREILQTANHNFCSFTTTYTNTEKFIHSLNKCQKTTEKLTMLATGYTMTENSSTCLKLPKIKLVSKGNYQNIKRQNTEWGNIFVNDISDEGLICKIYKELIQLNIKNKKLDWKISRGSK